MNLIEYVEPKRVREWGEEVITLTAPTKIKIQVTGPGAQILLDTAPPPGKTWRLMVRVETLEIDA